VKATGCQEDTPTKRGAPPASVCRAAASDYFFIHVVDEQTGRGVPLVELRTTSMIRLYTDSGGLAAFYEPGLMGQKVFFFVESPGYAFTADGFGMRGVALDTQPGKTATVKVKRTQIAQRLYRVTGQGIYRDSILAGREAAIDQPLLNAQVCGQDSVNNCLYQGKLYWFWGDTARVSMGLAVCTSEPSAPCRQRGWIRIRSEPDLFYHDSGFSNKNVPMDGGDWCGLTASSPSKTAGHSDLCHFAG
jgi:hypothetical protein